MARARAVRECDETERRRRRIRLGRVGRTGARGGAEARLRRRRRALLRRGPRDIGERVQLPTDRIGRHRAILWRRVRVPRAPAFTAATFDTETGFRCVAPARTIRRDVGSALVFHALWRQRNDAVACGFRHVCVATSHLIGQAHHFAEVRRTKADGRRIAEIAQILLAARRAA